MLLLHRKILKNPTAVFRAFFSVAISRSTTLNGAPVATLSIIRICLKYALTLSIPKMIIANLMTTMFLTPTLKSTAILKKAKLIAIAAIGREDSIKVIVNLFVNPNIPKMRRIAAYKLIVRIFEI